MYTYFKKHITVLSNGLLSLDDWQNLQGGWPKLLFAVGLSTESLWPITELQVSEQYFPGHRHCHCIYIQVVILNEDRKCYVECGFLWMMKRNIGQELTFTAELFLLGDKIYPNKYPVLIPYMRQTPEYAEEVQKIKQTHYTLQSRG